ncbi:MAG: hypothetical protein QF415_15765 [Candidatus Undinarchaeales archaeon]|jgi:hypothetical protein|nr:hypothetical protein [Candidatus Undinarchaeales archaeon]MDP7492542.1 hypothetical protein [Candidatus Undinarchaeales archaeon]
MEEIGTRVTIKPHMLRWSLDGTLTFSSGGTYPVQGGNLREVRDAVVRRQAEEMKGLEERQRELRREEQRASRRQRRATP